MDVRDSLIDVVDDVDRHDEVEELVTEVGFHPKFELDEAILRTARWYREHLESVEPEVRHQAV